MNLGICPMASSSSGNCFLVRSNRTYILLDAGISSAAVKKNLEMMDVQFWEMNGVVLTHEHIEASAHIATVLRGSTSSLPKVLSPPSKKREREYPRRELR